MQKVIEWLAWVMHSLELLVRVTEAYGRRRTLSNTDEVHCQKFCCTVSSQKRLVVHSFVTAHFMSELYSVSSLWPSICAESYICHRQLHHQVWPFSDFWIYLSYQSLQCSWVQWVIWAPTGQPHNKKYGVRELLLYDDEWCCVDWCVSVQAQSRRNAAEHSSTDRASAAPSYRQHRPAGVVPGDGHRKEATHGVHGDPAAHAGRHLQGDKASEQGDSGDDRRAARSEGVDRRQLLHERASSLGRQVHGRDAVVVVDVSRRSGQQRGRQQYRWTCRRLPTTVTSAALLPAHSRGRRPGERTCNLLSDLVISVSRPFPSHSMLELLYVPRIKALYTFPKALLNFEIKHCSKILLAGRTNS